jgi:hypothetical protein
MPRDPLEEWERVKSEQTPIKRTINGKQFTFPGACPATLGVEFMDAMEKLPDESLGFLSVRFFAKLVGDKDFERLSGVCSFPELVAISVGFFRYYGFLSEVDESPNPKGRASRQKSSRGSARSGRGSADTSASASRKTSKV